MSQHNIVQYQIKQNELPVVVSGFRSRSKADEVHLVLQWPSGALACTCQGFHFHQGCVHIKCVFEQLQAKFNGKRDMPK
jgi:hypothetical protein